MATEYYVDVNGQKDGPHDLVTVMRRIRTKKISKDTLIYVGKDPEPMRAASIAAIAVFFSTKPENTKPSNVPKVLSLLHEGWMVTAENSAMTVAAGTMLLIDILLAIIFISWLESKAGIIIAWAAAFILNNIYCIFMLRRARGQSAGMEFINQMLAPALPRLLLAGLVVALMIAGGFFLLVIPGIIVAVTYVFAPFLILDKRYSTTEAMTASRLLLQKNDSRYMGIAGILVALHFLGIALVFPTPISFPVIAAALARLYDELISG